MTEHKNLTAKEAIQNFQNAFGYTDEAIIRALECCAKPYCNSNDCPLNEHTINTKDCITKLSIIALDLINRQRAEIERLQEECDQAWEEHSDIQIKYDLLFDEAKALIEKTKSEAIKEFAERLKEELRLYTANNGGFVPSMIDNLVKEMTRRCPDCKHFVGCEAACGGVPCELYEKGEKK